ncbi:MAG: hypothetical protein KC420_16915, partial [Myxococcales bacterium]|nr:hypothetical protein [Myxococcales bacterium]
GGCAEPEDDAKVEVLDIEGPVAAADFCGIADSLTCAGALGCCADPEFADVDACIADSLCDQGLGAVLTSDAVAGGELIYDADEAGDYLRAFADSVSRCEPHEMSARPTFLRGSRGEGEDCTPVGSDITNTFTCASGLECMITVDAETRERKGTCGPEITAAPPGSAGSACTEGEQCASGVCSDGACTADLESLYCVDPVRNDPPSNADPTHLYIDLAGSSSGSSGDVTLTYSNNNKYWRCTITDTLSDGQEKVCAVTSTGIAIGPSDQFFDIDMTSNDGIRVDTVCACSAANTSTNKCTSEIECAGTFNKSGTSKPGWCSDASFNVWLWANACKKIWVDGDGNGSCTSFEIDADDNNNTTCES